MEACAVMAWPAGLVGLAAVRPRVLRGTSSLCGNIALLVVAGRKSFDPAAFRIDGGADSGIVPTGRLPSVDGGWKLSDDCRCGTERCWINGLKMRQFAALFHVAEAVMQPERESRCLAGTQVAPNQATGCILLHASGPRN